MYYIIMNPNASSGKGMNIREKLEVTLKEEQAEYEFYVTDSGNAATELVKRLTGDTKGKDVHLVVLGGDGSMNAVLNGIVDFEHTIVSCIRTGSGNDFARNTGVKKNAVKALRHLLCEPEMRCLDYGEVCYETTEGRNSRRYIISSGIGYDADICDEVGRSRLKKILNRVHLGKLVYVMIGVKQIFTRINTGAVLYMDGKRMDIPSLFFAVGMIHEYEGGGVPFCPQADCTDGMLDICLAKGMPKWKLLLAVAMVYLRKHYIFKDITAHRCKELKAELKEPQWFHVDGDTECKADVIWMRCHSGLRFCK